MAESQSFWRIYRAVTFSAQKKHWCDTIRVYTWGAHQIIDTPKGAYPLTFTAAKVQNVKVHLLYATKRFWSYRGGEKTKWLPRESHPVQKIKINYFIPPPNPRSTPRVRATRPLLVTCWSIEKTLVPNSALMTIYQTAFSKEGSDIAPQFSTLLAKWWCFFSWGSSENLCIWG